MKTAVLICSLLSLLTLPATAQVVYDGTGLSDEELDNLRGGFVTASGLQIDFGLTQDTSINGAVSNQVSISTANAITANGLNKLIQVGDTNASGLNTSGGLVAYIRNNVNNAVIQNSTTLDVVVNNTAALRTNLSLGTLLSGQRQLGLH